MTAVAPIVSVGLGVVSSMGAASAASKQANSQAKSLEQQVLVQKDQLRLSTQQLEAQKEAAEFLSERERTVTQAQADQARLLANENEMRQQLGYIAQENALKEQNAAVKQTVEQILGNAAMENTSVLKQNESQLMQVVDAISKTTGMDKQSIAKFLGMAGGNASGISGAMQAKQDLALSALDQYQQGVERSNAAERAVGYNTQFTEGANDLRQRYGDLANAFGLQNLDFQKQADALGNRSALSDIDYTTARNLEGVNAQKYATIGAANMSQANANFNAQNSNIAAQAQLNSINNSRPGLLSMANTLGQGFNALNQLGVFGMNKPQPIVQPTQAPGYSFYQGGQTMTPWGSSNNTPVSFNTSGLNTSTTLGDLFK